MKSHGFCLLGTLILFFLAQECGSKETWQANLWESAWSGYSKTKQWFAESEVLLNLGNVASEKYTHLTNGELEIGQQMKDLYSDLIPEQIRNNIDDYSKRAGDLIPDVDISEISRQMVDSASSAAESIRNIDPSEVFSQATEVIKDVDLSGVSQQVIETACSTADIIQNIDPSEVLLQAGGLIQDAKQSVSQLKVSDLSDFASSTVETVQKSELVEKIRDGTFQFYTQTREFINENTQNLTDEKMNNMFESFSETTREYSNYFSSMTFPAPAPSSVDEEPCSTSTDELNADDCSDSLGTKTSQLILNRENWQKLWAAVTSRLNMIGSTMAAQFDLTIQDITRLLEKVWTACQELLSRGKVILRKALKFVKKLLNDLLDELEKILPLEQVEKFRAGFVDNFSWRSLMISSTRLYFRRRVTAIFRQTALTYEQWQKGDYYEVGRRMSKIVVRLFDLVI